MADDGWGDTGLDDWGDAAVEEEEEEHKSAKRQRVQEETKGEIKRQWGKLSEDVILAHIMGSLSLKERIGVAPVSKELQVLSGKSRRRTAEVILDELEWGVNRYQAFLTFVKETIAMHRQGEVARSILLRTGDPTEFLNSAFFATLLSLFPRTEVMHVVCLPLNLAGRSRPSREDEMSAAVTAIFHKLDHLRRLEWRNENKLTDPLPMVLNKLIASDNKTLTQLLLGDAKAVPVAPLVHWAGAPHLEVLDLPVSLSVYADAEEAKQSRASRDIPGAAFDGAWGCAHVGRVIDRCAASLHTLRLTITIPSGSAPSNVHESMADLFLGLARSPKTLTELRISFRGALAGQPSLPLSLLRDLKAFVGLRDLEIVYPTPTPVIDPQHINTWTTALGELFKNLQQLRELSLDLPDVMRAYIATSEGLSDAPQLWRVHTAQPTDAPGMINEQRLMHWTGRHVKLEAPRVLHPDVCHVVTESKQPLAQFLHMAQWNRWQEEPRSLHVCLVCDLGALSSCALPIVQEPFVNLRVTELGQAHDVRIDGKFLRDVSSTRKTRSMVLAGSIDFDAKDLTVLLSNLSNLTTLAIGTPPAEGAGPLRSEPGARVLPLMAAVVARERSSNLGSLVFHSGVVNVTSAELVALHATKVWMTEFQLTLPTAIAAELPKADFTVKSLAGIWSVVTF